MKERVIVLKVNDEILNLIDEHIGRKGKERLVELNPNVCFVCSTDPIWNEIAEIVGPEGVKVLNMLWVGKMKAQDVIDWMRKNLPKEKYEKVVELLKKF